jgi:CoA:oxalate CoA-transferase
MSTPASVSKAPGALRGLKVVDLSRYIAGPHCAMLLGDLGADVIKVERSRGGDDTRALKPVIEGESLYFMVFNRNKRSLTLNFRDKEAQELLRKLLSEADVVVENFRPGTMEQMGCGWDDLEKLNPRLIMARISGYGQTGSMAFEPCFDAVAQATSGLMDLTGDPRGAPSLSGTFIVDYTSGLYATIAILAALERRHQTGRGQVVDASLMGSAISLLTTAIPEQKLLDRTMTRVGNRDRYAAPSQTFKAGDGRWLYINAGGNAHFPRLARAMKREDLIEDARFNNIHARMENIDAIEDIVAQWVAAHATDEIIAAASAAGVPCAKVATIRDVVDSDYVREAGHIVTVHHPKAGPFPMQGLAFQMTESPLSIRRSAPVLGAESEEVLQDWLHLSASEIAALRKQDIV